MLKNYEKPGFKKLLQRLQEESWQLELLISGFAVFALISFLPILENRIAVAVYEEDVLTSTITAFSLSFCYLLIINLLVHVFLRGLWIGTLGLRYVSGDIDYDSLKYSKKFTSYLKRKVGSFDKYISKLEDLCSIMFAITFLMIFYILSSIVIFLPILFITNFIIRNENLPNWFSGNVGYILLGLYLISLLIVFIDFVTRGYLKKKGWLSAIYFPIYRVFGIISLSFLYRPLVYNIYDNKFAKRILFIVISLYIIIGIGTSYQYNVSNYIYGDMKSNQYIADNNNYIDLISEENEFINDVAIQSKVITDNYIQIFVIYNKTHEDNLFAVNPKLKPEEDRRGYKYTFVGEDNSDTIIANLKTYLETYNKNYFVQIDSVKYQSEFIIAENKRGDKGFETFISTKSLSEGKHLLEVNLSGIIENDTVFRNVSKIPFWYYPD